jgi:hypothetical protein
MSQSTDVKKPADVFDHSTSGSSFGGKGQVVAGAMSGAAIGFAFGGPGGSIAGAVVGGIVGAAVRE